MRLALPLVLLLACAHSPPPPPGPRPLTGANTIVHAAARVELRVLYEVQPDRAVRVVVDLEASGSGSVGKLDLDIQADGFLVDGPATWSGELAAGAREQPAFLLRPQAGPTGWLKVRWRRGDSEAAVFAAFLIGPDEIRPCQAADEACKSVRDPAAPAG